MEVSSYILTGDFTVRIVPGDIIKNIFSLRYSIINLLEIVSIIINEFFD